MKPPKCKTCGAEEWQHVCGPGVALPKGVAKASTVTAQTVTRQPETVTRAPANKGGRGKKAHESAADKQRAYRARKAAAT